MTAIFTNDFKSFSEISVDALTHPPGYSIHKYWARKPHNVVRRAMEAAGVNETTVVLDPFCGSGVPLSEAAALGAACIGFDVNPIASRLTEVTLNPPDPEEYSNTVQKILDKLNEKHQKNYLIGDKQLRYVVHAITVSCKKCSVLVSANESAKKGRNYLCPNCNGKLSFNLDSAVGTKAILAVTVENESIELNDFSPIRPPIQTTSCYNFEFSQNPRILSHKGLHTSDLFTPRNFAFLSDFADAANSIPDHLRKPVQLTLTASVAQCSRLIAYRNNLSTGGPAWTVPGFWVPPLHIETNPILHLHARVSRTRKAFNHLAGLKGRGDKHRVYTGDSATSLQKINLGKKQRVVIFFDPPYGDSVPYVEFSAIWNSFLGESPDPGLDIAVSDRARGDGSWQMYERRLLEVTSVLKEKIGATGRLIVTFNNKDIRAWQSLLNAIQTAEFRCVGAFYQHPAVVSAKAQMANEGSYVGDIYALFSPDNGLLRENIEDLKAAVISAFSTHDADDVSHSSILRVALLNFVRMNITAAFLDRLPNLINEVMALLRELDQPRSGFGPVISAIVKGLRANNKEVTLANIEAQLHLERPDAGGISSQRLRAIVEQKFRVVNGVVIEERGQSEELIDKDECPAENVEGQLSLL